MSLWIDWRTAVSKMIISKIVKMLASAPELSSFCHQNACNGIVLSVLRCQSVCLSSLKMLAFHFHCYNTCISVSEFLHFIAKVPFGQHQNACVSASKCLFLGRHLFAFIFAFKHMHFRFWPLNTKFVILVQYCVVTCRYFYHSQD